VYVEITLDQVDQCDEQSEPEEHSETSTHLCELQGMNMLANILTVPRLLRRHLDQFTKIAKRFTIFNALFP